MIRPWLNESWVATAKRPAPPTPIAVLMIGPAFRPASGAISPSRRISRMLIAVGASRSGKPRRTVEIAFAWISLPGIDCVVGVGWLSWRFAIIEPTMTILPRKTEGLILPLRTCQNGIVGTVASGPA